MESPGDLTVLLNRWRSGDAAAANALMDAVYRELHHIAAREMRREPGGHTLQPTALVHEAYLRLAQSEPISWANRAHFYAVAARQLRRILLDHARRVGADKRGGGAVAVPLWECDGATQIDERIIAVDEALRALAELDSRAAQVVELRFFGGLSEPEAAEALGISVATLKRDWEFARSWIAARLA